LVLTTFLILIFLGAAITLIVAWVLYRALTYVPPFFAERLGERREIWKEPSDQFLQRATTLGNLIRKKQPWEGVFSEEQINGWLALEWPAQKPQFTDFELGETRVQLADNRVLVGTDVTFKYLKGVFWLQLEPILAEPNYLLIRIRDARLGRLRLPMTWVTEALTRVVTDVNQSHHWQQMDADPVLAVRFDFTEQLKGRRPQWTQLQISPGQLYLAGTTE